MIRHAANRPDREEDQISADPAEADTVEDKSSETLAELRARTRQAATTTQKVERAEATMVPKSKRKAWNDVERLIEASEDKDVQLPQLGQVKSLIRSINFINNHKFQAEMHFLITEEDGENSPGDIVKEKLSRATLLAKLLELKLVLENNERPPFRLFCNVADLEMQVENWVYYGQRAGNSGA